MAMKWFINLTKEGSSRAYPLGPCEDSAAAASMKTAIETDYPTWTVGDPYQAEEGTVHDTDVVGKLVFSKTDGTEEKRWSDGTQESA